VRNLRRNPLVAAAFLLLIASCSGSGSGAGSGEDGRPPAGLEKIDHIVIIMQENRSFDHYFGTFPGADGIPMTKDGKPTVCIPNDRLGTCNRPFHDPSDVNLGGPHNFDNAISVIDGGRMDGFVEAAYNEPLGLLNGVDGPNGKARARTCAEAPEIPICANPDLMGWHDAREIPNYWKYAEEFVLQDHMYQPNFGPSEPAHLYLVSGWSARCRDAYDASTCVTELEHPDHESPRDQDKEPDYAWADITWLLHNAGVSWAYYIDPSDDPSCDPTGVFCGPDEDIEGTPSLWNPLPDFTTVQQNGQTENIRPIEDFYQALDDGNLPSVVWIMPNADNSEHPPAKVSDGQAYVTGLINAIGKSDAWDSTAIFVTWDDWGGFYDHEPPPGARDGLGYGIRVPAITIGPYVKRGYIDQQTLSFDAYLRLIEDRFLGSQRLDPETDGWWDPRPSVREDEPMLGDLLEEFDFTQEPRPPLILQTRPPPGPASIPGT